MTHKSSILKINANAEALSSRPFITHAKTERVITLARHWWWWVDTKIGCAHWTNGVEELWMN